MSAAGWFTSPQSATQRGEEQGGEEGGGGEGGGMEEEERIAGVG
jgi:hypothetical protein